MPLTAESGAGEEFLKSVVRTAGNSAGNKGSAGKSAGSSAALLCSTSNGTASSALPATSLHPGTVPGSPRRTFEEFLSSTAFWGQRHRKSAGCFQNFVLVASVVFMLLPNTAVCRRAPDYSSNLCPPKI